MYIVLDFEKFYNINVFYFLNEELFLLYIMCDFDYKLMYKKIFKKNIFLKMISLVLIFIDVIYYN